MASPRSSVLTQMSASGGAVRAALEPVDDVLQVAAVTAALTPHKETLDHVVAHRAHAGALVAPTRHRSTHTFQKRHPVCVCAVTNDQVFPALVPVANPAPVVHGPLAVAAVDVQRGGGLIEAGDGAARAQLDHLVGHVPQLEALQQVDVGRVPVLLNGKADSNYFARAAAI